MATCSSVVCHESVLCGCFTPYSSRLAKVEEIVLRATASGDVFTQNSLEV
jgi:hypothetical protein